MKKIIKYLKFLIPGVFLFSCSDNFTDVPLWDASDETSFYYSVDQVATTVTAEYSMLCKRDVFDLLYTLTFSSIASDDAESGGENANDWPAWHHIDWMNHTPNDQQFTFTHLYSTLYKGIYCCNLVLKYGEPFVEPGVSLRADSIRMRGLLGETHFLRGFYHFVNMQVYGGIPIVDHILGSEEYGMGRNSIKEVIDFVVNEMDTAIKYLPEKSARIGEDVGRASKEAAIMLKAKALLYESSYAHNYPDGGPNDWFVGCEEHWQEVYDLLYDGIIAPGHFSLHGINEERYPSFWTNWDTTTGGFRHLFTLGGENCEESIFEIQNTNDQAGFNWTQTRGNYLSVYTVSRSYVTSEGDTDISAPGWGHCVPTHNLIRAYDPQDPRLVVTVAREANDDGTGYIGDSIFYGGDAGDGWYKFCAALAPTHTAQRKYELSPDQYWTPRNDWGDGPFNVRLMRYADVLLMAAEADIMLNGGTSSSGVALDYINQIRTRARVSADGGVVPADYVGSVTLDNLKLERRLELAFEGHRFFDLVRWGDAKAAIEGDGTPLEYDPYQVVTFDPNKHLFFPIGSTEIQLAGGGLTNPGW